MRGIVLRLLGIAERERARTLSMALLFFLTMAGLGLGRSAGESFFLGSAGAENVPYLLILNAVLMTLFSAAYSLIEPRISRYRFFVILLIFLAALLLLVRTVIIGPEPTAVAGFAVFAFYEIFLLAVQIHFWTYANDLFDPREGRRAFPFVGGAGLVGLIVGAVSVDLLQRLFGSTENTFFVWIFLMIVSVPVTVWTRFAAREQGINVDGTRDHADDDRRQFSEMFETVWRVPLVRALAILTIPLWFTVHTVDWLFLSAVQDLFPGSENDEARTAFLGYLNGLVSLTGLLVQLLLVRTFLRVFGNTGAFTIYPMTMALGAMALGVRAMFFSGGAAVTGFLALLHPKIWLAALARFFDESVLNSVHETSSQLLYNAVPAEERGLARAFINGAVEPLATAVSGIVLVMVAAFAVPLEYVAFVTAGIGCVWILLAFGIKKHYMSALVDNLSVHDIDAGEGTLRELGGRQEVRKLLLRSLQNEDHDAAFLALEYIDKLNDPVAMGDMIGLLPELADEVRVEAMYLLARKRFEPVLPELLRCLKGESQDLRKAAVRALRLIGANGEIKKLTPLLDKSKEMKLQREVMIAQLAIQPTIARRSRAYRKLVETSKHRSPGRQLMAARVIRELARPELLPILDQLAKSKQRAVREETIRAMGAVGSGQVIPKLVDFLPDEDTTHLAADAIVRVGEAGLGELHGLALSDNVEDSLKEQIIGCLGEIADPGSVPVLVSLLIRQGIIVEDAAIEALAAVKENLRERREHAALAGTGEVIPSEAEVFDDKVLGTARRSFGAILQKIERDQVHIRALRRIPNEDATVLLLDSLERAAARREELALKLLEVIGDVHTVRAAAASLRAGERRSVAEAIEILEGTGGEGAALAEVLERRLTAAAGPVSRNVNGQAVVLEAEDFEDLTLGDIVIELLITKQHEWFEACLAYCIGELRLNEFESFLLEMCDDHAPLIRDNAVVALEKIGKLSKVKKWSGRRTSLTKLRKEVQKMAINMERILFLRSVPLFADIDGKDLQWLNEIAKERHYKAGQVVFRENDVGDALYIIIRGKVRVNKGKQNITLEILEDRDCFGEMAILDQEPRSATVEIQEDATLLAIKREDFQRLLLARPRLAFSLFRTISRRLREATARFTGGGA